MDGVPEAAEEEERAERQQLAEAMAASLREEEARKASEQPIEKWSTAQLQDRYKSSAIIAQLGSTDTIFEEPCRGELIELLEFERQACIWFPGSGTMQFFLTIAKDATDRLPKRSPATAQQAATGSAARSGRSRIQARHLSRQNLHDAITSIHKEVMEAKDQVFRMPTTENEVPSIFRKAGEMAWSDSDVEVLDYEDSEQEVQQIQLLS